METYLVIATVDVPCEFRMDLDGVPYLRHSPPGFYVEASSRRSALLKARDICLPPGVVAGGYVMHATLNGPEGCKHFPNVEALNDD